MSIWDGEIFQKRVCFFIATNMMYCVHSIPLEYRACVCVYMCVCVCVCVCGCGVCVCVNVNVHACVV